MLCLAPLAFVQTLAGHLSRAPCRSVKQIRLLLQVFGPESSGKTTLALHAMAAVQKQGGTALLVDAEHAFDPLYSKVCSYSVAPCWQLVGAQRMSVTSSPPDIVLRDSVKHLCWATGLCAGPPEQQL